MSETRLDQLHAMANAKTRVEMAKAKAVLAWAEWANASIAGLAAELGVPEEALRDLVNALVANMPEGTRRML